MDSSSKGLIETNFSTLFRSQEKRIQEKRAEISQDKLLKRFEKLCDGLFTQYFEDEEFVVVEESVPLETIMDHKKFMRTDLSAKIDEQALSGGNILIGFRTTSHGGFAIAHNLTFTKMDEVINLCNYISVETEHADCKIHMIEDFKKQYGR
jgi:hypothetical protein